MTADEIRPMMSGGVQATCNVCDERVSTLDLYRHAQQHGYPLGGDFRLRVNGPWLRDTVRPAPSTAPVVRRTSKWS